MFTAIVALGLVAVVSAIAFFLIKAYGKKAVLEHRMKNHEFINKSIQEQRDNNVVNLDDAIKLHEDRRDK